MIGTGLKWSGLFLVLTLAVSVFAWFQIPPDAQIAVHWNLEGEADRWSSKTEALLMIPGIMILLIALMAGLPALMPRQENLQKSAPFYLAGWIGGCAVLAGAQMITLYVAISGQAFPEKAAFALVPPILIIIGNYMTKSGSNWLAGIRTPWTLESEHAWILANRTAGRGFVVTGLVGIAIAIAFDIRAGIIVTVVGALISTVAGVAVSYFAWRNDPERTT